MSLPRLSPIAPNMSSSSSPTSSPTSQTLLPDSRLHPFNVPHHQMRLMDPSKLAAGLHSPLRPEAMMNPTEAMLYSQQSNVMKSMAPHFPSSVNSPLCVMPPYDYHGSYQYLSQAYASLDPRRKNATKESTNTLKAWLYEHKKNPYPTKGEKIMLAILTRMTLTQVSTWFANARRRLKKERGSWTCEGDDEEDEDIDVEEEDDDDKAQSVTDRLTGDIPSNQEKEKSPSANQMSPPVVPITPPPSPPAPSTSSATRPKPKTHTIEHLPACQPAAPAPAPKKPVIWSIADMVQEKKKEPAPNVTVSSMSPSPWPARSLSHPYASYVSPSAQQRESLFHSVSSSQGRHIAHHPAIPSQLQRHS